MIKSEQRRLQGFPGGSVVKNSPASVEDTGSIPGPGRSHVSKQLIPLLNSTTTTEPVLKSLGAQLQNPRATTQSPRSATREATAMRRPGTSTGAQPPLATTREKPAQKQRPSTALKKKKDHRSMDQKDQVHTNLGLHVKKQTGWYCVPFLQENGDSSYPQGQIRSWRMRDCDRTMTKCYAQVSCSKDSLKVL